MLARRLEPSGAPASGGLAEEGAAAGGGGAESGGEGQALGLGWPA